jgi:Mn-containing catalase
VVAADPHPEGAPAFDLPAQPAVFAPDYAPEEIQEIAQTLRKRAGLPDKVGGVVAQEDESGGLLSDIASKVAK